MKNFLPLIILLLIIVLFSILAFQSSKIIDENTNQYLIGGTSIEGFGLSNTQQQAQQAQ